MALGYGTLQFFMQCDKYSETYELGIHKGLLKTVLNSEMVLFLRSFSMY